MNLTTLGMVKIPITLSHQMGKCKGQMDLVDRASLVRVSVAMAAWEVSVAMVAWEVMVEDMVEAWEATVVWEVITDSEDSRSRIETQDLFVEILP
mmetsp:Transcript_14797/g.17873  ORF Transcript_14797/g.17873 Transcript_14797/m.17873 type:complete len:95 (-) Transcript_14797:202-486(-)